MPNSIHAVTLRSRLLDRAASAFARPVDWSVEHAADAAEKRPGPETQIEGKRA